MSWRLAPCLLILRAELNARWPNRDRASDGAIGDAAHAASWSDHNPNSAGVVCAIDIDTDLDGTDDSNDPEMGALVERLRLIPHPDLKYVIYRGRMFSRYPAHGFGPFEWRPYKGDSHVSHPHVSVGVGPDGRSAPGTYDNTAPWLTTDAPPVQEDEMTKEEIAAVLQRLAYIQEKVDDLEANKLTAIQVESLFGATNGLYAKFNAQQALLAAIAKSLAVPL